MSSSSKKKKGTRSKSTINARKVRRKRVKKRQAQSARPGESRAAVQDEVKTTPDGSAMPENVQPVSLEAEPVPQPVINTSLLPEEAPNIVTGYVRLITLGVSFFLAVYLGLEAFSIFVSFPAKLPISTLLMNYGHLSSNSAAYALVGIAVAEVAVVQLWAWRTRQSSEFYEEFEEEPPQAPAVAPESAPTSAPVLEAQAPPAHPPAVIIVPSAPEAMPTQIAPEPVPTTTVLSADPVVPTLPLPAPEAIPEHPKIRGHPGQSADGST